MEMFLNYAPWVLLGLFILFISNNALKYFMTEVKDETSEEDMMDKMDIQDIGQMLLDEIAEPISDKNEGQ